MAAPFPSSSPSTLSSEDHHRHSNGVYSSPHFPPGSHSADLLSTLSALKALIRVSESTINSLLSPPFSSNVSSFSVCPFDPHHRMPPESLFSHCLRCPSSGLNIDDSIIQSLRYPKTLHDPPEKTDSSSQFHNSDAEFSFELGDYRDSARSFFYRDCPGAVSSYYSPCHSNSNPRFNLPGVILEECTSFVEENPSCHDRALEPCLPSELWSVTKEIEEWNDFPDFYSSNLTKVILLSSETTEEVDHLKRWVLSNSPVSWGILIDPPLTDHVLLLLKLCWRAIVKEANGLMEFLRNSKEEHGCYRCPTVAEVMQWLSMQLSVIYGGANATLLALSLLKQILLGTVQNLLSSWTLQCSSESESNGSSNGLSMVNPFQREKISLSQVTAAVTALHERSFLEDRIRGQPFSQPLSHRLEEHVKFLNMACEERKKRSDFHPIIDYDGLLTHRSLNLETNHTMKTREEMLAEERDYKRRRMSYRGKKMKRSWTEVMRDIIGEYMEEIKATTGCSREDVHSRTCLPDDFRSRSALDPDSRHRDRRSHCSESHTSTSASTARPSTDRWRTDVTSRHCRTRKPLDDDRWNPSRFRRA